MILEIRPLSAGNALQITHQPPAGALLTRLLRKATNDIADQSDTLALVAYEGLQTVIVDAEPGLQNLTPVFYRAFYLTASGWVDSPSVSGTPQATYEDRSTDVQALVRDRLEAGLAVEVARDVIKAGKSGAIAVKTAPPVAEEADFPIVTVEWGGDEPSERGIGEVIQPDFLDPLADEWVEHEGWLAGVRLTVTAWSLNPNERRELRRAIRRIIVANLPVFDAAGMVQIAVSSSDMDFLNGEFKSPMYTTVEQISCVAPVIVTDTALPIADIQATAIDIQEAVQPVN